MSFKMIILGTGGVGKSAFVNKFVNHDFSTYFLTSKIGKTTKSRKQVTCDDKDYVLEIYDTAGQEGYESLRLAAQANGDGFFLVYALDNRKSFTCLRQFREELVKSKQTYGS
eukprot:TRINITY_DN3710_c0_g1_i4.p1 TRINITY_DN3710_c0_g1~~TRINITY_DN3710_c0_g1_i4.p1  ORF type:complete len:112 (-),score=7.54 TRINITY_DN3710_c0_g1_i4:37-372(-)